MVLCHASHFTRDEALVNGTAIAYFPWQYLKQRSE